MKFKDVIQKTEFLMEVLYPELFPESNPCSESLRQYARALDESGHCSALAETFEGHIFHMRERVLEEFEGSPELASRLSMELASHTSLWDEALILIRNCEEWSRGRNAPHSGLPPRLP